MNGLSCYRRRFLISTTAITRFERQERRCRLYENLVDNGETLKVCGVVKPKEGEKITSLSTGLYYSNDLIDHLIDEAGDKQIVKDQQANPSTNVITGKSFAEEEDEAKDGDEFDMSSLFTIDGESCRRVHV